MQKPLVMTIIGKDRTGLVESLARLIAENHGNWLESRMCRLGGEFAGILRVQVPEAMEQGLIQALRALYSEGLTLIIRPDDYVPFAGPVRTASLSLLGHDRPGIIYQISAILARYQINVEALESECFSAPMSGEPMFSAMARLLIPESCVEEDLRRELERMGSELMVDISFAEN